VQVRTLGQFNSNFHILHAILLTLVTYSWILQRVFMDEKLGNGLGNRNIIFVMEIDQRSKGKSYSSKLKVYERFEGFVLSLTSAFLHIKCI